MALCATLPGRMSAVRRSPPPRTLLASHVSIRCQRPRLGLAPQALFNLGNLFKKQAPASRTKPVRPTVIPEPAYNVQLGLLAIAGVSYYEGLTPLAAISGLLGVFLIFQATRVKFVFDDEALEVIVGGQESDNKFVGGQNRWTYDSFVNWEFWWPNFPVLVYFKETQTKPEGQIHFFPVIFNGATVYKVMSERCGPSKTSAPKRLVGDEEDEDEE